MIRALLIDDEERVLMALQKNIRWKKCGVDYIFLTDCMDDAILCYKKHKPDLLICDIEMPDGTGLELLERLKEMGHEPAFVFVTCHPEFDYMRKAMQLGSIDYLLKPVEYEELERVICRIVDQINHHKKTTDVQDNKEELLQQAEAGHINHLYTEDKIIIEAKEYIKQHLLENISVQDLAQHLNISISHLMRTFKKKTGYSVREFVTDERMRIARQLLKESDLQINVIAEMTGYDDCSYFTRVFKKEVGETPREYRNKYSNTF